ncbi:MAG: hypothetical protein PHV28_00730 [Kiritimatiellae bacterium]|nr:hypothetical protein [Kiritimatiellia bacterium]
MRMYLILVLSVCSAYADVAASAPAADPVTTRWTFGAHEPYTMYRRMGRRSTGGIDGNALWVKPWLDWFDAESPALMQELGLNMLHSRFYKGMGWEVEKKDFPNVKRFVANCHAHGVRALAYVQFSTLYPEVMRHEIPNVDEWTQVNEKGEKVTYFNDYFRWMPCITCREWEDYIKRMCTIALAEGGFDGVMFDNTFVGPCYCKRCERLFHEHLMAIKNPSERFGFDRLDGFVQPRGVKQTPEMRDPLVQEWMMWRRDIMLGVLIRLRAHIKSVKPDAVISANVMPVRRTESMLLHSIDMTAVLEKFLDLSIMQQENFPCVEKDGGVVNRVRDLKLCAELGRPVVALCDAAADMSEEREKHYMRPLLEDLFWRGIPTDRTVISPAPVKGFVDRKRVEKRKPQLERFNRFALEKRTLLNAPSYQPVRLVWSPDTLAFSKKSNFSLAAAEEIFLRNHVPFGYSVSRSNGPLSIPADCEVLVVPGQTCLSANQIDDLAAWADKGGKLIVTGDSGRYDERNAQRLENPLLPRLAGKPNVITRAEADVLPKVKIGWSARYAPPADGGRALMADLAKTGFKGEVEVVNCPQTTFADIRKTADGYAVLMLNYAPEKPVTGATVRVPAGAKSVCTLPFEPGTNETLSKSLPVSSESTITLPDFRTCAVVVIK